MKTALLFGSTGLIGALLLRELLADPGYRRVVAVVRRLPAAPDPRVRYVIADIATLPSVSAELVADDVFIAIGTTHAKTPDRAEYTRIDHDYPVLAARLAKENGASCLCLVSSVGADPASSTFYLRTKGDAERDVIALGFAHTHVFRPSLLLGERSESRPAEKFSMIAMPLLAPLLRGSFSIYRAIAATDVARAMHAAAGERTRKLAIHHWREIETLAHAAAQRPDNAR